MNVENLTLEETEQLLGQVYARLDELKAQAETAQDARTSRIEDAIAALDALLGPEDAEPGTDSIREVRGFSGEDMAENAAIALPLAFHGLEILTTVVRDIASSIAHEK